MAISKIKGGAINDDAISTAKIQNDAVTSPKIVDSYTTALQTNPEFSGTEGARMPNGTTAQRASAQAGDIRFNTTTALMEYYTGAAWKSIDSPPTITSISPDNFDTAGDTITISGSNFQSGATVKIKAVDAQELSAASVTITNSSTATFDITAAMVADDNDPYDVIITNSSGLSGTINAALDFAPEPAWTVAAGSLGNIFNGGRTSLSFTTGATTTESDATITYAVTTGALPSGLSIASSTGTITGSTSSVGSDTTVTFTITATATDGGGETTTNARQYSIVQKAPVITSYTSTGSGTYSVPTGLTTLDVLVVAGGGGGGFNNSGGGGAGGLIYRPAFPVTPAGSVSYTVGGGGNGTTDGGSPAATNGQDSVFGTLTAKGGGRSLNWTESQGMPGGSGGGAPGNPVSSPVPVVGQGIQPQQSGDSGTYGFGNPGGLGVHTNNDGGGGGGGGAGAVGGIISGHSYPLTSSAPGTPGGVGGIGKAYSISGSSVTYAGGGGGGGGGADNPLWSITGGAGGQGGGGGGGAAVRAPHSVTNAFHGHPGQANRGGGGGGGDNSNGGAGGSGVVIITY